MYPPSYPSTPSKDYYNTSGGQIQEKKKRSLRRDIFTFVAGGISIAAGLFFAGKLKVSAGEDSRGFGKNESIAARVQSLTTMGYSGANASSPVVASDPKIDRARAYQTLSDAEVVARALMAEEYKSPELVKTLTFQEVRNAGTVKAKAKAKGPVPGPKVPVAEEDPETEALKAEQRAALVRTSRTIVKNFPDAAHADLVAIGKAGSGRVANA